MRKVLKQRHRNISAVWFAMNFIGESGSSKIFILFSYVIRYSVHKQVVSIRQTMDRAQKNLKLQPPPPKHPEFSHVWEGNISMVLRPKLKSDIIVSAHISLARILSHGHITPDCRGRRGRSLSHESREEGRESQCSNPLLWILIVSSGKLWKLFLLL